MLKAKYYTLGCKLNQSETVQMSDNLRESGIAEMTQHNGEHCDLVVVNTCAVTGKAAAKSRHLISRVTRDNPGAVIVVAGCLAQLDPDAIAGTPGVDYVLGTSRRFGVEWWQGKPDSPIIEIDEDPTGKLRDLRSVGIARSRSMLKIQDGCNCRCSYCIIPRLRGRQRSVDQAMIIDAVEDLVENGVREIVLTGVRIGSWGNDFIVRKSLSDLIRSLISIKGDFRIRLGSLEPWELNEELIEMMIGDEKICAHLHVPLQHSSPEVLKLMNRPDNSEAVQIIRKIKLLDPDFGLGADIITGFPGETGEHFTSLYNLINEIPLTYLHVFGYSERPGTVAVTIGNKCSSQVIKKRVRSLRELGELKRTEFMKMQTGRIVRVIPDARKNRHSEHVKAITDNYIKVNVPASEVVAGEFVRVKLEYRRGVMLGKVLT